MTVNRMRADLLVWGEAGPGPWPYGAVHVLPPDVPGASAALRDLCVRSTADWWLLWDPALGRPPEDVVRTLATERDDVLHAGLLLGTGGVPDDIDLIQPTWWFGTDPPTDVRATSWRLSLRACMVRVAVVRALGGLDPAFRSLDAAGLDLGRRYLARGALPVHEPRLLAGPVRSTPVVLPLQDRHVFLLRHHPPKWVRYAVVRRAVRHRPGAEIRAFREAGRRCLAIAPPVPPSAVYARAAAATTDVDGRVTVILPTLGREDLVADVLGDLRRQTVPPVEVICVDQNGGSDGDGPYGRFPDLPLRVIRQAGRGQWLARNAAIEQARGDFLLFLDDDSRIEPDFVEEHLRCLAHYGADVSAGASLSVVGAPVPSTYGYFRAADQFDSGNAMVRREVLERVGAFDRHYDRMRSGDADWGTRAYLAGALLVHNPRAARVHLKAPAGGLRTFGSWDSYRQRGLLTPRPLPSVVYYARRHFSARQAREALLIGLAQSAVPYHLKRRASARQWARSLSAEAALLPISVVRVLRSLSAARRMLAEGPRIPAVPARAPSTTMAGP